MQHNHWNPITCFNTRLRIWVLKFLKIPALFVCIYDRQVTDSKILQEYITQEGHKLEIAPKPPMAVTNAVSWRSEGLKYRKNEVFLDVVESVNLLVSASGNVLRSEIVGAIKMRVYLSGMPELRLGLNDKVCKGHICYVLIKTPPLIFGRNFCEYRPTHTHNHFMALWTLSGTTRVNVNRYQKVHFAIFWIFWSKMKITQADAPTIWMDCHPIQSNWFPHLCHPHHFYAGCPSLHNPPNLSLLGTGTKYAGLHTQWLGCIPSGYWPIIMNIQISQCIVPTQLRWLENLPSVTERVSSGICRWKIFENQSIFTEVTTNNQGMFFIVQFALSVMTNLYIVFIVTHTHNRFTALLKFVRDHPGEQVPER